MILKKAIVISLFFTLSFFSVSCNQSQKETILNTETNPEKTKKEDSEKFSLSNKLYLLAPDFNTKDCEAYGECDCCGSNYLFLDDENFICVDYCLDADTFYSGKYKIKKEKVELKYNAIVVQKENNWEKETDTITIQPDYFYKTEKCKPFQWVWVKFNCKEKICFKSNEKEPEYASIDKTQTSENFLSDLKREGILEMLSSK